MTYIQLLLKNYCGEVKPAFYTQIGFVNMAAQKWLRFAERMETKPKKTLAMCSQDVVLQEGVWWRTVIRIIAFEPI